VTPGPQPDGERDLLEDFGAANVIVAEAEEGRRKLTLRVLGGNDSARRLYESRGFEIEGTLRGAFLLDGDYVDDHLMALDLT
jgi:RimJ/RimL family protein N-acetyltransferase